MITYGNYELVATRVTYDQRTDKLTAEGEVRLTEPGGNTFAANIALRWNEARPTGLSALIASGLVLFVITLAVNMFARIVIARRAEFSGANS